MIGDLRFFDQPLAQQQLNMRVIARAFANGRSTHQVDAAVADMRPVRGTVLHQADRAGRAGSRVHRYLAAEGHQVIVRTANGQVHEALGVEQRLGNARVGLGNGLAGDFGGLGAIGVPAHAVDHDHQHRLVARCDRHPILVLATIADETDFRVFDLHDSPIAVDN